MPEYEIEWTNGEEVVPGFLAIWSAAVEAEDLDAANRVIDELEREQREIENLWDA